MTFRDMLPTMRNVCLFDERSLTSRVGRYIFSVILSGFLENQKAGSPATRNKCDRRQQDETNGTESPTSALTSVNSSSIANSAPFFPFVVHVCQKLAVVRPSHIRQPDYPTKSVVLLVAHRDWKTLTEHSSSQWTSVQQDSGHRLLDNNIHGYRRDKGIVRCFQISRRIALTVTIAQKLHTVAYKNSTPPL